jgi:enoyl-CoA hydratase
MFVSVEASGAVTVVRVDRAPANAITLELLDELVAALEGLAADAPAALVIAGRVGFFSAGVDLKAVPGYGPDEQRRMVSGINSMVLATYGMSCPVVAAVTGHAIAGGLVLALCADLRIASVEGRYGLTEIKVGVPYPQAAIGVVRAELPSHAARRLVLSNELIDGTEALRLGLFDEVLAPDAVLERAVEVATEMSALPAGVYAATKHELRSQSLGAIRAAVESEPLLESWLGGDPLSRCSRDGGGETDS